MSWMVLEENDPELAVFGLERFDETRVAYLATLRKDGAPRLHPVTPIIGEGHLFLFMEPTSPKGYDLRRDGRYVLHSSVRDSSGAGGEFHISGRAWAVEAADERDLAVSLASYAPEERYVLFEFGVEAAASTVYVNGEPQRRHWEAPR